MSSSLRAFSEGSDGSDVDSGPEDTPDSDNTLAPFVLAVTISSLAAREANRLEYEAKRALEEAQSAYKKAREVTKEAVAKVKLDEAAWKKCRSALRQEAGMSYGAAEELERTRRRQERMEAQRAARRQEQQPAAPPTRNNRRTRKRARGEGEAAADAAALRAVGKGPVVEGEGGEDSSDKGALAAGSALCPPPSPTPPSVSDSGSDGGGDDGTAGQRVLHRCRAAAKAAAATALPPAVTGVSVPTDTRVPAPAVAFADHEEADQGKKVGWKQGTLVTDDMMDEALRRLPAQHPGVLERLAATDPGISIDGSLTWRAIVRAKVVLLEAMTRNAGVTGDEAVTGAIAASTAPLCPAPSSPPVCLYRHNG